MDKSVPRQSAKLPNQLKKHLAKTFSRFDEYQLAKYNGGSKSVSLKDAMRLLHPVAENEAQSALWKRLLTGELATPDTWEVELSASKDKKESWNRLLVEKRLGGLAMLRNIRNMVQAGVEHELIEAGIKDIHAGKILPVNFVSAARYNPQFEPVLEAKFLECFTGRAKIKGKTIILVDVSGSMNDRLSDRGELKRMDVATTLAMVGKELFTELRVFTFSNSVIEVPARKGFALRDAIISSQYHSGTYLGAAVDMMPKDVRLIVITDEQSADKVEQRNGYMVNVASAKNGVGYHQWTHIDGWSDKIFDFIIEKEQSLN